MYFFLVFQPALAIFRGALNNLAEALPASSSPKSSSLVFFSSDIISSSAFILSLASQDTLSFSMEPSLQKSIRDNNNSCIKALIFAYISINIVLVFSVLIFFQWLQLELLLY